MSLRCATAVFVCGVLWLVPIGTAPATDSVLFKIVNQSKHPIHAVEVSQSSQPKWGRNLLNGRTLQPGEATTIGFEGTCGPNDLRLYAEKGLRYVDRKLMFCSGTNDAALLVVTVGERTLTKTTSQR